MRKYVVELIGTFFLVFTVGTTVIEPKGAGALAPLAIGAGVLTGLSFATPIYAYSATQRGDSGFSFIFRFIITPRP